MSKDLKKSTQAQPDASKRKFLRGATAATAGAALAFPMIARGQTTPISMRWQSTWPAKDNHIVVAEFMN